MRKALNCGSARRCAVAAVRAILSRLGRRNAPAEKQPGSESEKPPKAPRTQVGVWLGRPMTSFHLVIAVTDDDWFEMLRHRPDITEVNFWVPSAANFRALQPGELFLFKLHAPRNIIVGGGIFGLFAGIYYWFPKVTGRMYHERQGQLQFWWMFIGFNLTFLPMLWLGIQGMNRRIAD